MDQDTRTQERIARQQIEEDRRARPVTYLSTLQKKALLRAAEGGYDHPNNGVMYDTPDGAALQSLGDLGLVKLVLTKGGVGGRLTDKGWLLLYENPKLRFSPPEGKRWKITTTIAWAALFLSFGSLIVAIISLLQQ